MHQNKIQALNIKVFKKVQKILKQGHRSHNDPVK